MTTQKIEYDSAMGGPVELPDLITTYKYSSGRIDEIQSLISSINNPNQTKLIFQKLPKHMRRRAMSHNPKRLPRKYRQSQMAQMLKSGKPAPSKRPSRKYRRKSCNLMREYSRRQRRNIWLETHIWHAKRFHMIERWGYKLPLRSCDKTFRSNYRATTQHCLIQDISFFGCVELCGPVETIRQKFEQIQAKNGGLGLCAKAYIDGRREGSLDLFKLNQFPCGALGRIQFMWKPPSNENNSIRTAWLFAHASFYKSLVQELKILFELIEDSPDEVMQVDGPTQANIRPLKPMRYFNSTTKVEMTELKDQLNRFRLTGPLSQAVLSNAFICTQQSQTDNWFGQFVQDKCSAEAHHNQSLYWSSLKTIRSPSELCPNMILALNINDPRTVRPKKRTKARPEEQTNGVQKYNSAALEIPQFNGISQLWCHKSRAKIFHDKMSTSDFCKMRNKQALVPGEECAFERDLQPIPVLIIQRPGITNQKFKQLGYGCGWDVICPAGYGISTWIALIMWGSRAGGLREIESTCRESGTDEFLPDTLAAKENADLMADEAREKYFRLPPNKRPNYNKLSITSPFKCPWLQLIQEWNNQKHSDYYVIRHLAVLEKLKNSLNHRNAKINLSIPENCLIPIYLSMENRGHPINNSIICLPTKNDSKANLKKRQILDNDPVYAEPLKTDPNDERRKQLRTNHLKLLKRLRTRRIRTKRRRQQTSQKRVLIAKPQTAKLIETQRQQIRELWLPEIPTTVRNQCSRQVIGYLTQAGFSFTEATSAGIGYLTLNGFKCLLQNCYKYGKPNQVLIRSPTSRQYRFAVFRIKCD